MQTSCEKELTCSGPSVWQTWNTAGANSHRDGAKGPRRDEERRHLAEGASRGLLSPSWLSLPWRESVATPRAELVLVDQIVSETTEAGFLRIVGR